MLSVTLILLAYIKYCHRPSNSITTATPSATIFSSRGRFSGIDKTIIESLPFFRFSSLRGSRNGLECAVCLSKFEEVEVLRLLPKCKHAFHIDCIDEWLSSHSSCPLCRRAVSSEDATLAFTSSLRFLGGVQGENSSRQLDLFVERVGKDHSGRVGDSSRRSMRASNYKEEEAPIHSQDHDDHDQEDVIGGELHKFDHRIVVSDLVFKKRWSSLSSADLLHLNSHMINEAGQSRGSSSLRFSPGEGQNMATNGVVIKEEMERKRVLEQKLSRFKVNDAGIATDEASVMAVAGKVGSPGDRRSMSEITLYPRSARGGSSSEGQESGRAWFPIARGTVEWYANNRMNRTEEQAKAEENRKRLNV